VIEGSPRLERALIALTPVVALATVAVGLRIGASAKARGARVSMTSPGTGRSGLALQLTTLSEEGGIPEVISVPGLHVVATVPGVNGGEAEWRGESNDEGVAEAWLDLPPTQAGTRVELSIRGDVGELGSDVIVVPATTPAIEVKGEVHATRRSGDLTIQVFVLDGKLVPGAAGEVFVRVLDATGRGAAGVTLSIDPEPGLAVDRQPSPTSMAGWSQAEITAEFLTAGWTVRATGADNRKGEWFGSLPVAPGGARALLTPTIDPGKAIIVPLSVPPATHRIYVEVDDEHGRDFASIVELPRDGRGSTSVTIPGLAAGRYWLVTSASPRGAETLGGATVARPFHVGPIAPSDPGEPTAASLAELAAPALARTMVLDGLVGPRTRAAEARRKGIAVGLASLFVATVLEMILVIRAGRRSQQRMLLVDEAAREAGVEETRRDSTAWTGTIAVLALVTLLGFALVTGLLLLAAGT
jgi:hypothetical protein